MHVPLLCPLWRLPLDFWPCFGSLCPRFEIRRVWKHAVQTKTWSFDRTNPLRTPLRHFAARPASQAWERLTFPDTSQNPVWAWFKPATAPNGVILRVPDEIYRDRPDLAAQWTVRKLLQVASLEPALVSAWVFNGVSFPAMHGASPYLDAPPPWPLLSPTSWSTWPAISGHRRSCTSCRRSPIPRRSRSAGGPAGDDGRDAGRGTWPHHYGRSRHAVPARFHQ